MYIEKNIPHDSDKKRGMNMQSSDILMSELKNKFSAQDSNPKDILDEFVSKSSDFKKLQHGIYSYKNHYILHGAMEYFDKDINGYQIAQKTNIQSAPVLSGVYKFPEQETVMILDLPCDADSLSSFDDNLSNLSLVERLQILDEFKKMLNNDYINVDAIETTKKWKMTPDNRLVLMLWNDLVKITDSDTKKQILDKIKKYLRVSNDNPNNIFCTY